MAIRGSSCQAGVGAINIPSKGDLTIGSGFRYFKSFRHFRGSEQEKHRLEAGTEVINNSYFLDLSLNYGISNRFFSNVILPFVYHDRSSMYEHGGNPPNGLGERHQTFSKSVSKFWLPDNQAFMNLASQKVTYLAR